MNKEMYTKDQTDLCKGDEQSTQTLLSWVSENVSLQGLANGSGTLRRPVSGNPESLGGMRGKPQIESLISLWCAYFKPHCVGGALNQELVRWVKEANLNLTLGLWFPRKIGNYHLNK